MRSERVGCGDVENTSIHVYLSRQIVLVGARFFPFPRATRVFMTLGRISDATFERDLGRLAGRVFLLPPSLRGRLPPGNVHVA